MPSAEVPLMMPATVMVFAFMLEVPGAGAGRPLWFGQSAQFDCEELQAASPKALVEPRQKTAWCDAGRPGLRAEGAICGTPAIVLPRRSVPRMCAESARGCGR